MLPRTDEIHVMIVVSSVWREESMVVLAHHADFGSLRSISTLRSGRVRLGILISACNFPRRRRWRRKLISSETGLDAELSLQFLTRFTLLSDETKTQHPEIASKYDAPAFEVVSTLFRILTGRKIITPGSFQRSLSVTPHACFCH
jgi:hypothetical protein